MESLPLSSFSRHHTKVANLIHAERCADWLLSNKTRYPYFAPEAENLWYIYALPQILTSHWCRLWLCAIYQPVRAMWLSSSKKDVFLPSFISWSVIVQSFARMRWWSCVTWHAMMYFMIVSQRRWMCHACLTWWTMLIWKQEPLPQWLYAIWNQRLITNVSNGATSMKRQLNIRITCQLRQHVNHSAFLHDQFLVQQFLPILANLHQKSFHWCS